MKIGGGDELIFLRLLIALTQSCESDFRFGKKLINHVGHMRLDTNNVK